VSRTNSRSIKKLRTELKRLGLSQAEFSRLFQVSATTVQNWVSGKTSTPAWVGPALKLYEALPEMSREEILGIRRIVAPPQSSKPSGRAHPFARIEDL
jgi:transcriptional regulator with XRE-family HTH domain